MDVYGLAMNAVVVRRVATPVRVLMSYSAARALMYAGLVGASAAASIAGTVARAEETIVLGPAVSSQAMPPPVKTTRSPKPAKVVTSETARTPKSPKTVKIVKPAKPIVRQPTVVEKLQMRPSVPADVTETGAITPPPPKAYDPPSPGNPVIRIDPSADSDMAPVHSAPDDPLAPNAADAPDVVPGALPTATPSTALTRPRTVLQPLSGPRQAVAPLGPTGTPVTTAVNPRVATTPNPRSTAVDPRDDQTTSYDQIGIRTGSFTWRPAVETSIGMTSNVQGNSTGTRSAALRLAPELIGQSDWSQHQLGVDVRGSLTEYPVDWSLYRPSLSATVTGRIDVSEAVRINLKTGYTFDRLSGTSSANAVGTSNPGLNQTLSTSLGVTRDLGTLALTLRGDVDRSIYGEGTTGGTTTTNPTPLNNTHFALALRGAYALSAGLKPFIEAQVTGRRYDTAQADPTLAASPNRNALGSGLKVGATLDFAPYLSGEASVGYATEKPSDASLAEIRAVTLDGTLTWSPTRLTRVTVTAATAIEPTQLQGASGAVTRTVGVKLAEDIFRNLTAELGGSVLMRSYTGAGRTETLASATTGLTWKFNPYVQSFVRGSFDHFTSSAKTDNYQSGTVFAGFRLQR